MAKLVECVPNVSEGRDQKVLDQLATVVRAVAGVKLLDVDPGADTNRTVFTFVGSPEGVGEAAFQFIKTASELIDMHQHQGAHARQGATDVCPFVPVSEVTMQECVDIAKAVGKRVGDELGIPVYLYEEAATKPERRNLANVRKGGYESLAERLSKPEWQPDFGPAKFHAKAGATAIGARQFLIAYNINLNSKDVKKARQLAFTIREQGKAKRDANRRIVRDQQGNIVYVPGLFKHCKATGWYIEEYGQAQVTMNLTNYHVSPLHEVFEAVRTEADKMGVLVTGSELVGLVPKEVMLEAGRYYFNKQKQSAGVPERELVNMAVRSLGLNDLTPFDPQQKIIENQLTSDSGKLR